jgi:hypothetical protein
MTSQTVCEILRFSVQPRQLGDIHRDPPRLVFGEQLGGRSPARLFLEIDIRERLSVVVADEKDASCSSTIKVGRKRREDTLSWIADRT